MNLLCRLLEWLLGQPDASARTGRELHLTRQDAEVDAIAHNARVSGAPMTTLATKCAASDDEKLSSGAAPAISSDGGGDGRANKPDGVSPRRKAIPAAARGKCRTPMSDVGNTENAKEGNTKKSVASAGREPLAPQVTAFGVPTVTSRPKDTNAMPPPPPAAKVQTPFCIAYACYTTLLVVRVLMFHAMLGISLGVCDMRPLLMDTRGHRLRPMNTRVLVKVYHLANLQPCGGGHVETMVLFTGD